MRGDSTALFLLSSLLFHTHTRAHKTTSKTIAGYSFSVANHVILRAVSAARGYRGNVWVPEATRRLLQLPLCEYSDSPVQLSSSNGYCSFHHLSQVDLPSDEVHRRWNEYARRKLEEEEEPKNSARNCTVNHDDGVATPLSLNGEPFTVEVANVMLQCGCRCRYWATPEEASYLFLTPFRPSYLADSGHAVAVPHPFADRPLLYYNVEGTCDVTRFTSETCRRYDPYNYEGFFYRPIAALAMKRFAIYHRCLDQPRWVTPTRAERCGSPLLPHVSPLQLSLVNSTLQLINISLTKHPVLIEEATLRQVSSSAAATAGVVEDAEAVLTPFCESPDDPIEEDADGEEQV